MIPTTHTTAARKRARSPGLNAAVVPTDAEAAARRPAPKSDDSHREWHIVPPEWLKLAAAANSAAQRAWPGPTLPAVGCALQHTNGTVTEGASWCRSDGEYVSAERCAMYAALAMQRPSVDLIALRSLPRPPTPSHHAAEPGLPLTGDTVPVLLSHSTPVTRVLLVGDGGRIHGVFSLAEIERAEFCLARGRPGAAVFPLRGSPSPAPGEASQPHTVAVSPSRPGGHVLGDLAELPVGDSEDGLVPQS